MPTFIHAADIHLDSPLRGLERYEGAPIDAVRGAARDAFTRMIDLAIEERAAFIVLAGDLYDGDWKDYNTGLFIAAQMARLDQAGIPAVLISGNHDAANRMTRQLRLPANVHRLPDARPGTVRFDHLGVAIHGQGFATASVMENLAASYPAPIPGVLNIGLLHTSLDGRPGHDPYAPCAPSDLQAKGYAYWALGHVHDHEIVSRDPWIVYPGIIQGRHIRETGAKGCVVATYSGNEILEVEHRPLDVMRWAELNLDAGDAGAAAEVVERVETAVTEAVAAEAGRTLAVRIRISGRTAAQRELAADPGHWTQEIRAAVTAATNQMAWVEKVRFDTAPPIDEDALAERDDAFGALARCLRYLEADEAGAAALWADAIEPLRGKVPPELLADYEGDALTNLDHRKALMREVSGLLWPRLAEDGELL